MLRPSGHWPHRSNLRRALRAPVRAAVPEVWVHALQIERAFDEARKDLVVRQIRRVPPQELKVSFGNLFLDLVPMLRALFQLVRLPPDHFDGVHSCGRARWIRHCAAYNLHRGILERSEEHTSEL